MRWRAVTPQWVVPSPREVEDAHWLAYRSYTDGGSVAAGGVGAALAWVRGGRAAPVTGRSEQPVTEALARAEMWAATAAERPDISTAAAGVDLRGSPCRVLAT